MADKSENHTQTEHLGVDGSTMCQPPEYPSSRNTMYLHQELLDVMDNVDNGCVLQTSKIEHSVENVKVLVYEGIQVEASKFA
ncbi:hypothetical protein HHI36_008950 [Cryptolaemus montrouzieri]|uniref:Uncharacterized protein n=1 Tax=Cryptolaemus montrouzieri TaxID=559131 RepID=A0ABD2MU26_9CUCU